MSASRPGAGDHLIVYHSLSAPANRRPAGVLLKAAGTGVILLFTMVRNASPDGRRTWLLFENRSSIAHIAVMRAQRLCPPIHARFAISAANVGPYCGPNQATAASSARMARRAVHRSRILLTRTTKRTVPTHIPKRIYPKVATIFPDVTACSSRSCLQGVPGIAVNSQARRKKRPLPLMGREPSFEHCRRYSKARKRRRPDCTRAIKLILD